MEVMELRYCNSDLGCGRMIKDTDESFTMGDSKLRMCRSCVHKTYGTKKKKSVVDWFEEGRGLNAQQQSLRGMIDGR